MKKIFGLYGVALAMTSLLGLSSVTSVIAAPAAMNYYSSSSMSDAAKAPTAYHLTNIVVYNSTNLSGPAATIRVIVPQPPHCPYPPVNFPLNPGQSGHVYSDYNAGNAEVILQDSYGNKFFDQYVWSHAALQVVMQNGQFHVNHLQP